mgnify:CR=1 FL=1
MLIFDLETDGLLDQLTKIHCLWIYDTRTKRYHGFNKQDVPNGLSMLAKADAICGHNILGFDIPAIKKVHPEWSYSGEVYDTLIWARLLFPDIKGTDFGRYQKGQLPGQFIGLHKLEAWGYRIGAMKGEFAKQTDWKYWSPEMSEYCKQDVTVTFKLKEYLESFTPSYEALELEQAVASILERQKNHGFLFATKQAETLYESLAIRKSTLWHLLQESFPPFYTQKGQVFTPKANSKRYGYVKDAPMCKIALTEFNPGSGLHVYWALKRKYGWKPTEFTDTGQPKVDEDVLKGLEKSKKWPEVSLLMEYLTIDKRMQQIHDGKQGWLKQVNKETNRIHGFVNHNGAVTGRMTHSKPNLGQVPSNGHAYGKDCRSLFIVPEGYKLVGCDADGIEGRCLAHYLSRYDDGAFIETILRGNKEDGTDMHNQNRKALEIESRNIAKTWFYAWMYGAGNQKLAKTLGVKAGEAKKKNEKFLDNFPAMKKLKRDIEKAVKNKGYLRGLDGRHLNIRSPHSALNTLLQSAGALIMKKALVILDETLQTEGLIPGQDYEFVANVHDEWQIEVKDVGQTPEFVGQTAAWAIEEAGKQFNFRCPLAGNYDIGNSWAETH